MNTNNKTLPLLIGIVVVFVVGIILLFVINSFMGMKRGSVTIKDTTFSVEIAKTASQKEKGLSGRKALAENKGMIFPFDTNDYVRFWMRDMKFPIDILFIRDDRIVTIYENVPAPATSEENANPPVYAPTEPVNRVLELQAGSVQKLGVKQGDTISIKL